ncbi:MAG TPA: hypothetical protein VHE35_16685 [Kofleriaceae bacterium]|nr:hypothetical protein [Kofleriaceae bacterium]
MGRPRSILAVLAAVVLAAAAGAGGAAGCGRAEDSSGAKRTPRPPAPPRVDLPADLRIAVTIDGVPAQAVDAGLLGQLAPDFVDTERRAWRVRRLVPALGGPGAAVEAVGGNGISVRFEATSGEGLEPVLFLTRRGEVVVAMVDPAKPFPEFHGQGGRLGRPGDPLPHVGRVTELRVVTH